MKPVLTLSNKCGQLEVQWKKGEADAIRIEVDRGHGKGFQLLTIDNFKRSNYKYLPDGKGFQLLTIGSIPNYTDLAAITKKGTWKYRAIYLLADKLIGRWSDEVSITI